MSVLLQPGHAIGGLDVIPEVTFPAIMDHPGRTRPAPPGACGARTRRTWQVGPMSSDTSGTAEDQEQFVSFGEQGAQLTYGSYLRLPQLLDSQHLESDPPAHDELLFITIHQVYELWFKQLLHEAAAARDAMTEGRLWWAQHLLQRVHVIERVLVHQVDVLETMTPQDFLEFRQRLAPASGFQSVQFRELEFLSGAKDAAYVDRFKGLTERGEPAAPTAPRRADPVGRLPRRAPRTAGCRRAPTRRSSSRCAPSRTTASSTPTCGR